MLLLHLFRGFTSVKLIFFADRWLEESNEGRATVCSESWLSNMQLCKLRS